MHVRARVANYSSRSLAESWQQKNICPIGYNEQKNPFRKITATIAPFCVMTLWANGILIGIGPESNKAWMQPDLARRRATTESKTSVITLSHWLPATSRSSHVIRRRECEHANWEGHIVDRVSQSGWAVRIRQKSHEINRVKCIEYDGSMKLQPE